MKILQSSCKEDAMRSYTEKDSVMTLKPRYKLPIHSLRESMQSFTVMCISALHSTFMYCLHNHFPKLKWALKSLVIQQWWLF